MASITQDMSLSLIRFAEKYGVSKAAINIRPTVSIFIAGSVAMTIQLNLCETVLVVLITAPTSIHRKDQTRKQYYFIPLYLS